MRLSRALLALPLLAVFTGCDSSEEQSAPQAVFKAECRRATGRIKLDGVLDEVAWERAPVLKDFAVYWQNRKPKTATTARLLWDDEFLYFCAEMEDEDLCARVRERNGMTWLDDVFELF